MGLPPCYIKILACGIMFHWLLQSLAEGGEGRGREGERKREREREREREWLVFLDSIYLRW